MERRTFYQYLWSAILTSLSGILCVQIDGIIVSHLLGTDAFAAIGVLMPVVQIQLTLCLLIGVGGALCLAYAVGSKDRVKAGQIFRTTIVMLLVCSVPFIALSAWSPMVAGWFCHEESLMPLASDYARVLLLSAPVYLLLQGSGAMVRAEGFPKRILWAMVLANVLNLSMDMLFISCFHWGIAGAGWATTISNVIALCIILAKNVEKVSGALSSPYPILLAGLPLALGSVAMFVRLSYLTTATSAHLGAEGMVTLSLLLSVFLFVNLLAGGTSQALQPLAGQYIGQGDKAAMRRTCRRSLRFAGLSSLVVTGLVVALARPICIVYGIDESSQVATMAALRIFAVCFLFNALGFVLMVIHQILGNKTKAMVIAVVQPLLLIPVYALMLSVFRTSVLWFAFPIAEFLSLIFILILSVHELRQIYTTAVSD